MMEQVDISLTEDPELDFGGKGRKCVVRWFGAGLRRGQSWISLLFRLCASLSNMYVEILRYTMVRFLMCEVPDKLR
jgi:hypothetical protein